jgi:hypothetical protein
LNHESTWESKKQNRAERGGKQSNDSELRFQRIGKQKKNPSKMITGYLKGQRKIKSQDEITRSSELNKRRATQNLNKEEPDKRRTRSWDWWSFFFLLEICYSSSKIQEKLNTRFREN